MKKAIYRILAGVADFYFLSFSLGVLVAFSTATLGTPIKSVIVLTIPIVAMVIVLLYHWIFSKRVSWLSLGEYLIGVAIEAKIKQWTNPYNRNRWALFLLLFLTIIISSNVWDGLGDENVYSVVEVMVRTLLVSVLYFSVIRLGMGKLRYAFIPIIICVITLLMSKTNDDITMNKQFANFMVGFSISGIAAYTVVPLAYRFLRKAAVADNRPSSNN